MIRYFLFILMLMSGSALYAQPFHVDKSESFGEPNVAWNKVLQLKNGNTFYFRFIKNDSMQVIVFDKLRKKISDKKISSNLWDTEKMSSSEVNGLFEISGEPVLFITQRDPDENQILYRLRFDPLTGSMEKEEVIGKNLFKEIRVRDFYTSGLNAMLVEKDPESDCYAVIFYNTKDPNLDTHITVDHYDGNHKKINTAHYLSPDKDFKYIKVINACVDGSKRVYLVTYGTKSKKGEDAHVFISRLNLGESRFQTQALEFTENFRDTKSELCYNHSSNTLQLLTLSYAEGRRTFFHTPDQKQEFLAFLTAIDPEMLKIKSVKPVTSEKINAYAHSKLGLNDMDYLGLPQQMVINKDNSITLLCEDQSQEVSTVSDGATHTRVAHTNMGSIGISELNEDGSERDGYLVEKNQIAMGLQPPLYISSRRNGKWIYYLSPNNNNSFMSYDYINTGKERYVIFNDNHKNFDKKEDDFERKKAEKLNNLNTVCYSLGDGSLKKYYLFGEPQEKKQSISCYMDASDFCSATKTYATLIKERNGKDEQVKIAWVTFE